MSTAAQEVKVLEGRLAAAKEKAAKESRTDTLASGLAARQEAINAGERQVNLLNRKLAELEESFQFSEKQTRNAEISVDAREAARRRTFDLQAEQRKLNTDLEKQQNEIQAARSDLTKIRAKISEHPVFAEARKEQRDICDRAVELALGVWRGPLTNAASLHAEIENLSRDEQAALARWNPKLAAEGLPKLKPRLYPQLGNLIPNIFLSLDLPRLRADCQAAMSVVLQED